MAQSFLEQEGLVFLCMVMACFRVYLEFTPVDLKDFPLSRWNPDLAGRIHKAGLYLSVGYIVLFAPEILLS